MIENIEKHRQPYFSGFATCLNCGFEYACVCPYSKTSELECKNCHKMTCILDNAFKMKIFIGLLGIKNGIN